MFVLRLFTTTQKHLGPVLPTRTNSCQVCDPEYTPFTSPLLRFPPTPPPSTSTWRPTRRAPGVPRIEHGIVIALNRVRPSPNTALNTHRVRSILDPETTKQALVGPGDSKGDGGCRGEDGGRVVRTLEGTRVARRRDTVYGNR